MIFIICSEVLITTGFWHPNGQTSLTSSRSIWGQLIFRFLLTLKKSKRPFAAMYFYLYFYLLHFNDVIFMTPLHLSTHLYHRLYNIYEYISAFQYTTRVLSRVLYKKICGVCTHIRCQRRVETGLTENPLIMWRFSFNQHFLVDQHSLWIALDKVIVTIAPVPCQCHFSRKCSSF